jgi:hypothetical protein
VREAREAKATLDAVGGAAKIAELQQHVTRSREIDELIEAGDPRAIDAVLETGSKGLAKLLPSLIEKLSTTESAAVQAALQPHVFTYLDAQGMPEAIDAMVAAFNSGKPDDAKAVLSKIVNWWKQSSAGHAEATSEGTRTGRMGEGTRGFQANTVQNRSRECFQRLHHACGAGHRQGTGA